jgi:hypothetical protein
MKESFLLKQEESVVCMSLKMSESLLDWLIAHSNFRRL